MKTTTSERTDDRVIIVGGGPVGLTLAALLARQGIPSRVIESDEGFCIGSRAICLSRRSMEILSWIGASDAVAAKGLPWTTGRSYFREKEVLAFQMPHAPGDRFAPMTNIQQFYVEQYVHDTFQRWPGMVEMMWSTTVESVAQHSEGAVLHCRSAAGSFTLRTPWVIACDGGRSAVRESMGLPLKGTAYEGRYVIVDVKQQSARPTERLAWFDPPSNPGSTVLMHRQPDDVWRIDYQVREGEDPEEAVRPENVLARVGKHLEWIGERAPWEPQWISIYNAKCLTLENYRHGRVLFAGDAAHLVPIFGVRGLNSGLDDAGNLGWKLARVLRGEAGVELLDSYSAERRDAALANIDYGSRSTEFMAPPHRGFSLMRDAALRLAATDPLISQLLNPRQSSPVQYRTDVSTTPDHGFDDLAAGRPGTCAPEASIFSDGQSSYATQNFGDGHVVLSFGQALRIDGAVVVTIDMDIPENDEVARRYGASVGSAYVIRPDGYIAARWRSASSEDVDNYLKELSRHEFI